jgi:hypothetical protein
MRRSYFKRRCQRWAFGETERRDLQLCLLGPAPEHDCILSISRLDVTKKIEPAMAEPVEVLSAFAPQLASLR